jgi:hypothetical protein
LVELSAALDNDGSWAGTRIRSCAHWLSINIGVNVATGAKVVIHVDAEVLSGAAPPRRQLVSACG